MKTTVPHLLILPCLLSLALSCGRWQPVRGMYVVEDRIAGTEEITVPNLEGTDFYYLVAPPRWEAADFDRPMPDLLDRYVDGHRYERPKVVLRFIETAHAAGAKVLCSFPGEAFIDIAPDSLRRTRFARMAAAFARRYGYDGIELDWEQTVTPPLHIEMMEALRYALDSLAGPGRHPYLTTALNSSHQYDAEQAARLSGAADWINLMYYDMGGGIWGQTATHNAPLDRIRENFRTNWSQFDPARIHLGLASYGYAYRGLAPGGTVEEGRTLRDYFAFDRYQPLPGLLAEGWREEWDAAAQCPYFVAPGGDAFMTAENARSLRAKLRWARETGLGGIFWWEFHCDWVPPSEGEERGRHLVTDEADRLLKHL